MSETKYFCRRISEFDISELGLSEKDLKYAKAAFKRQSYLVVAARKREEEFLMNYLFTALRREDREKGICVKRKDDYWEKAYEISKRIYKKIDEAGYIRHDCSWDHKNLRLLFIIVDKILRSDQQCIDDAKSHRFSRYDGGRMTRRADEWLDGIDDLKKALRCINYVYFEEIDGFSECETEKYETYDFEKLDHAVADVMHNIFTPKQMEMMEWIGDYRQPCGNDVSSCVRVYTEEERTLYSAAMCSVLTNACYIKEVLERYL
ncbi:hypothetical protein J6X73_00320 [Candidatus Saccharibacteria bacterium]|nr:hypothetical protein [Candidatus Saccharibacteria bacterium]